MYPTWLHHPRAALHVTCVYLYCPTMSSIISTPMVSTSDALIAVAENILANVDSLSSIEIAKRGRRYKFLNDSFQRVTEEDKHLIVHPDAPEEKISVVSAYKILKNIDPEIFVSHKDLCLLIIGLALALEENHWYEEENSSVINYRFLSFSYGEEDKSAAMELLSMVTPEHLEKIYVVVYCSKLNFLHTDHHIGTSLEGDQLRHYMTEFLGAEALELETVLTALKCFVHWANIKGLLYKLQVPNIDLSEESKQRFDKFPDPPQDLVNAVYDRFPSGNSKYSLLTKLIDILRKYKFSYLVPYPTGIEYDYLWLIELCENIKADPARYHFRCGVKKLTKNPANLAELAQANAKLLKALLEYVALVLNVFDVPNSEFILQSTRLPKFLEDLVTRHADIYTQLMSVREIIDEYESKGWTLDDIVARFREDQRSIWDADR